MLVTDCRENVPDQGCVVIPMWVTGSLVPLPMYFRRYSVQQEQEEQGHVSERECSDSDGGDSDVEAYYRNVYKFQIKCPISGCNRSTLCTHAKAVLQAMHWVGGRGLDFTSTVASLLDTDGRRRL